MKYSSSCFFTRQNKNMGITVWNENMGITVRVPCVLWKVKEWYLWKYCFIVVKKNRDRMV